MSDTALELDFDALRCLDITLAEKLAAFSRWEDKNLPKFGALYKDLVERLTSSGAGSDAIKTGSKLLQFILPDVDGRLVNSDSLLASGPLVVSFNRGYWCPYCKLELLGLAGIHDEVKALGAEIVSITPQRVPAAKRLREAIDLPFAILCDMDNSYALSCGLMMANGDAVHQALLEFGVDLGADQGNHGMFLPLPATYVVAQDGKIIADYVHPDFRTRMAPHDILAALGSISS